ncbi:hypothetical protein GJ496_001887 [Pomphorhynchus laevis]|nr:hypothetical protein GJ496_006474 [Pomphorhynchus laevis]KAI0984097.1 hypothetical protein GJ496_001887 [Pomphorhynchus laevis]
MVGRRLFSRKDKGIFKLDNRTSKKAVISPYRLRIISKAQRLSDSRRLVNKDQSIGRFSGNFQVSRCYLNTPKNSNIQRLAKGIREKYTIVNKVSNKCIVKTPLIQNRKIDQIYKWNKRKYVCTFFIKTGKCKKGLACPFKHDFDKVMICMKYLQGRCTDEGEKCTLSHNLNPTKIPMCIFQNADSLLCENTVKLQCPFMHRSSDCDINEFCLEFPTGECPHGANCKKFHTLYCPDLARNALCSRRHSKMQCPFLHSKKQASYLIRQGTNNQDWQIGDDIIRVPRLNNEHDTFKSWIITDYNNLNIFPDIPQL